MSIVQRYKNNPILTRDDVPYPVTTVHNAGVTRYNDRYIMIFRSHLTSGRSILGLAESDDGIRFKVAEQPFMTPATEGIFRIYEEYGIEDPRITYIDDEYLITYSAYSQYGARIGLARTSDFKKIERILETLKYPQRKENIGLPKNEILNFCISRDFQRKGIGKKLFTILVDEFKSLNFNRIKIVTGANQIKAQKFYESLGAMKFTNIEVHRDSNSFIYVYNINEIQ